MIILKVYLILALIMWLIMETRASVRKKFSFLHVLIAAIVWPVVVYFSLFGTPRR